MDINNITSFISQVGFPIAVCAYLLYQQNKAEERHKAEIDKLRESLDNNTKVMNEIYTLLNLRKEN